MNDSDFITVFNIAEAGYRNWFFPASGLIFIAVGALMPRLIDSGLMKTSRPMRKWFPAFFFGFAVLWTTLTLVATLRQYLAGRETLLSGRAGYVEGEVQNFVPMPYQGHAMESFNVKGVPFRYSDYVVGPGFNTSASHGGPIHQGVYVRIWYSGNDILKLQVPKNEKPLSAHSLPASARRL